MARDIALIEPDPQDWGWWVTYFLDQLEEESKRRGINKEFIGMVEELIKLLGE